LDLSKEIKDLINNSLWSFFGTVVSKALMFFAWIYVANYFGKEINGEIGILRSTINLFISFVGTGFGLTLTKYIPKYLKLGNQKINKIISASFVYAFLLAVIISAAFFLFSPLIVSRILHKPSLLISLQISSILLFLSILNGVLFGFLQGFQKFKELSFVNIVNGVSLFIFLYIFSRLYGVNGTFIGFTLSILLTFFVALFYIFKILKTKCIVLTTEFKSELPVFYSFTMPAIMSGLMVVPFKWVLDTLLVNQKGGYVEMGLFSALFLFHTLILMTINTLNAPMITLMAKETNNTSIEKLNVLIPWVLGIFIAIPFLIFPDLLGILFGNEYIEDPHFKKTAIFIIITTVLVLYKNGLSRIMIINNLMWFSFLSNLVWGIVLVASFYYLVNKNAVSISFAYTLAYLVNIIIVFPVYIKKKIIPFSLVLSKEAIGVWSLFISLVYVSFLDMDSLLYKSILLLLYTIIFIYLFFKMFFVNEKK
jgi:O-antigen/teichoic acid export membrane protein